MSILVGVLMILFINGSTTADEEEFPMVGLLKSLYEWSMKIYDTIEERRNPDKSRENIVAIMNQVNAVSTKIDALETHLDIKLDAMLNMLLADIRLENNLNELRGKVRHCVSKIDRYFDESKEFKVGGAFGNQTLKDFSHKALWSTGSITDFLDDMHEAFFPVGVGYDGFLSLMLDQTVLNILHDCDTFLSPQQKVYYIFIQVFITEIKGLMSQQQAIMTQRWFDETSYNYTSEINVARDNSRNHLRDYYAVFNQMFPRFSQHLRRCEPNPPVRGVSFIELQKFDRIAILDANTVISDRCLACPSDSTLNSLSQRTNTTINDCKNVGTELTVCPAELGSPHEYLWWRDEKGKNYGPVAKCANEQKISGGSITTPGFREVPQGYFFCKVCACIVQTNDVQSDTSTIWRISVTSQTSDFYSNKVVTGVRFVIWENALHLQIQQARFKHSGMIYEENEWKDLNISLYEHGLKTTKAPMYYERLRHDRKTLYLDDIKVPQGFAVTGVRFQLVDDTAFQLQIFMNEFNLDTGEVFRFAGEWINVTNNAVNPADYKRKRFEINMGQSDDPTRASQFKYDLDSNSLIKFTHSDINKDAGQTTIPLIESLDVTTQPPFPLGGIGISFKGRDGFGGYIAPRIFTLDVTDFLELPDIDSDGKTVTKPKKLRYEVHTLDGEIYRHSNQDSYQVVQV